MRLDLDRHRTLGELIGLAFELFGRHLATFLSLTLIVVAPIAIVVDGGWGGGLADGGDAAPSAAATVALYSVAVAFGLVARSSSHCRDLRDADVLRLARPQLAAVAGATCAARGAARAPDPAAALLGCQE